MIRIFGFTLAVVCLTGNPAHAQDDRWSDTVEVVVAAPRTVVVKGARPYCPTMWRLKRGESVVWVLPTLTTVTYGMRWDDDCFKQRLKGARYFVVQSEYVRVPAEPTLLAKGRIQDVVSPETYARYRAAAKRAGESGARYERYSPGWAATFFLRDAYSRHNLVNQTYPPNMLRLARGAGVPTREVALFTGDSDGRNSRNQLDAAGDEACLNSVLDRLDHTHEKLPTMIEAWRKSDMPTVLKLFPPEDERCFPARADGLRIREENQNRWSKVLRAALHTPGKTVVAMPLSWFLYRDGALDQVRADDVEVSVPEGVE